MAAKSIVNIQVNAESFTAFHSQFKKYEAALSKAPHQWGLAGGAVLGVGNTLGGVLAKLAVMGKSIGDATTKSQKFGKALQLADRVASGMVKSTAALAVNLKNATMQLMKWGSIAGLFSGLLGAGGLFGISRLAESVSGGQTASRKTGDTYGQGKASGIAYGQLFGGEGAVQSMLEKIAYAQKNFGRDAGGTEIMTKAGISPAEYQSKTAADLLPIILRNLQSALQLQPKGSEMAYAESTGMTNLASSDVLIQLINMQVKETAVLSQLYEEQKKKLDLDNESQNKWTALNRALSAAGELMENTFIKALTPLTPALTKLSEAVSDAVKTLLGSDTLGSWIDAVAVKLKEFATYLSSPQFKSDIAAFLTSLDKLAGSIMSIVNKLDNWFGGGLKASDIAKAEKLTGDNKVLGEKYRDVVSANKDQYSHRFVMDVKDALKGTNSAQVEKDLVGTHYANQATAQAVANQMHIKVQLVAEAGGGWTLAQMQ